jgi:hypothetical protein
MLKRYRDLFVRKIIAALLLMVGFSATDISGQQSISPTLRSSDCKTIISSCNAAKISKIGSSMHMPIISPFGAARLIFLLLEMIKEKSRDSCSIQQPADEKLKESLFSDSRLIG